MRVFQSADLVTSCVIAYVAGENVWSARVFVVIKPLFHSKHGKIEGYGLKFHCTRRRNLYHTAGATTTQSRVSWNAGEFIRGYGNKVNVV
jgi:hypothetical protein